jgi:hypothetical protein
MNKINRSHPDQKLGISQSLLLRSVPGKARSEMLAAILAGLASFIGPILLGVVIFLVLIVIFA